MAGGGIELGLGLGLGLGIGLGCAPTLMSAFDIIGSSEGSSCSITSCHGICICISTFGSPPAWTPPLRLLTLTLTLTLTLARALARARALALTTDPNWARLHEHRLLTTTYYYYLLLTTYYLLLTTYYLLLTTYY